MQNQLLAKTIIVFIFITINKIQIIYYYKN